METNSEIPSVYLLNLQSQVVTALEGYTETVWGVAFSPDGHLASAGGVDGIITLWDVATATKRTSFPAHDDSIGDVSFSPDGELLISASFDGTLRVWDDLNLSLIDWITANRDVPEFTCNQRAIYGIEPLCEEDLVQ